VPHVFGAADADGRPIYHTNVVLSVGQHVALVGTEAIASLEERRRLLRALRPDLTIIELTLEQIANFAGNALELTTPSGPLLAISKRGWAALTPDQQRAIERRAEVLPVPLPTIEKSGGSARCMLAGIHLQRLSAGRLDARDETVTSSERKNNGSVGHGE
jgi:hypothetical protein